MIKILKFYFLKSWGRARFSAGLTAQFQKEKKNFFPKNWAGWAGLLFSLPARPGPARGGPGRAVGPGPGRAGHISIPGLDHIMVRAGKKFSWLMKRSLESNLVKLISFPLIQACLPFFLLVQITVCQSSF